jgi:tetratricopeptide (TPR) repeat protein
MKNYLVFIVTIILATNLSAQTISQEGKARELNSNNQPIPGVFIKFENSASANSDSNGNFRLYFLEKKSGDIIFLEDVKKSGYELVNQKELEVTTLTNAERLNKDIILAKIGVIDAAKKEYYGISDKALTTSFEKEKNKLKSELNAAKLNQQDYLSQLQSLQEQYDLQKKSLDDLSEKFATTNFDDVEPIYLEALELFKNGDILSAIAKLENTNSSEQTSKILKEEKRIAAAQQELDTQKENLDKIKQNQISAVSLLADMYSLNFDRIKAKEQYDQLISLDSSDIEILQRSGYFYKNQHFYEDAIAIYKGIIKHPEAKPWQIGDAQLHLGDLYTSTGSLKEALNSFKESYNIYKDLQIYRSSLLFKNGLAQAHWKIGVAFKSLGLLEKSLTELETFKKLQEELVEALPDNVDYKRNLAVAYEKLGITTSAIGDLKTALEFFLHRYELAKQLTNADPSSLDLKNHLALANFYLGKTYEDLGDLPQALNYFTENLRLNEELVNLQPKDSEYKLNLGFANQSMGIIYSKMGDLKSALTHHQEYNSLEKEIVDLYPLNIYYKTALAISFSYVGQTYFFMGELEKSLVYYAEEINLFNELHQLDPINTDITIRLANAYKDKGWSYMRLKNYEAALENFSHYKKLNKELFMANPKNSDFKYVYAVSSQAFGRANSELGKHQEALENFKIYNEILEDLYKSYPEKVDFKNSLAISYEKLGQVQIELGNYKRVLDHFLKELKLFEELSQDHSENLTFKKSLAVTYANIGDFYLFNMKDKDKAVKNYRAAEAILLELIDLAPNYAEYKNILTIIQEELKN